MRTLYDEVVEIATQQGIKAESGYAGELSGIQREYPMMLWIPPDPRKFEGRTPPHRITYRCHFYLMEKDDGRMLSAERERKWAEMERRAYAMILRLGETESVQAIEEVTGGRDRHMLTPDGEMSVKMEFTCQFIVCDD